MTMTEDLNTGGLAAAAEAEPEVVTADLVITERPEAMTQAEVDRLRAAASDQVRMVATAREMVVTTGEEETSAVEFLAQLQQQKKDTDAARKFLTKPLQNHVAAIIARFRPHEEALDEAMQLVKDKVVTFQAEERRRAEELQRKLDEEREARERELAAQREAEERRAREAREAAEAEAREREAEARRQAEAAAAAQAKVADELRAEMAALPKSALGYQAAHGASEGRKAAAQAELDHRAAVEAAEAAERERLAAAERQREAEEAERAAREAEVAEVPRVEVQAPTGRVRAASGSANASGHWKHEVTDFMALVKAVAAGEQPLEFLEASTALGQAVRRKNQPVREVPGVRIYRESGLTVRGR